RHAREQDSLGERQRHVPPGVRSDEWHQRPRPRGVLPAGRQRLRTHEHRVRPHDRQRHSGSVLASALRNTTMSTLTPASVRKQIASGTPDAIYLLQGEDESEKSALAAEFTELLEE